MRRHQISFQRLEEDYAVGGIRSVEVDHDRRMLVVIADNNDDAVHMHGEMSTVPNGGLFTQEGR